MIEFSNSDNKNTNIFYETENKEIINLCSIKCINNRRHRDTKEILNYYVFFSDKLYVDITLTDYENIKKYIQLAND